MTRNRRRRERQQDAFPVTLSTPHEPAELEGMIINFSEKGALLRARGRITVLLGVKGKQYRGRLVRASTKDVGLTECAIELEELLEPPGERLVGVGVARPAGKRPPPR